MPRAPKKPKPQPTLSGLDLASWQAQPDRIRWAQGNPFFREVVTVLINERVKALVGFMDHGTGISEGRKLGRVEGYEAALEVMKSLAFGPEKDLPPMPDPDYPAPERATDAVYD